MHRSTTRCVTENVPRDSKNGPDEDDLLIEIGGELDPIGQSSFLVHR